MLEDVLPITSGLRERLLLWADRHNRFDGGERNLDMTGFDERGYALSRALSRQLGGLFSVTYYMTFSGGHQRRLRERARIEPLPRWQIH